MSLRFSTVRTIILALLLCLSCISVGISVALKPIMRHQYLFYTISCVSGACALLSSWMIFRKLVLKQQQLVATEIINLLCLFPFRVVLVLITVTSPLEREGTVKPMFFLLQVIILTDTVISLGYTCGLLFAALTTCAAFDSDVWVRDIDSSPSPFPMPILFNYLFPCINFMQHRPSNDYDPRNEIQGEAEAFCLPGCQCDRKLHGREQEHTTVAAAGTPLRPVSRSSRLLVRVPNAVERRLSVTVAFEV